MTESPLEQAERHVREGAARIARQEVLLAELERDGHENLLPRAREALALFKSIQAVSEGHLARERMGASKREQ